MYAAQHDPGLLTGKMGARGAGGCCSKIGVLSLAEFEYCRKNDAEKKVGGGGLKRDPGEVIVSKNFSNETAALGGHGKEKLSGEGFFWRGGGGRDEVLRGFKVC